jgi:hypothetical protein
MVSNLTRFEKIRKIVDFGSYMVFIGFLLDILAKHYGKDPIFATLVEKIGITIQYSDPNTTIWVVAFVLLILAIVNLIESLF